MTRGPSTTSSAKLPNGSTGTIEATTQRAAQTPSTSPAAPPASETRKPSVRSWRRMRARPPPSDWRIAISVRRAAPRARNMLARLRQATSSTIPAIAIITADAAVNAVSLVGCEDKVNRDCVPRTNV